MSYDDYIEHAIEQADDRSGERWTNPPMPAHEDERAAAYRRAIAQGLRFPMGEV